ncbi:CYTH domain-containing protein [Candidatus Uhrbacteria bacterium]|nr:CYTH domain-containing protein [Candidatus Uhrbacteria bacterium]
MNKINLELKHFCQDFAKVREVLEQIGAHKEIVKNQKDYFFFLPAENGGQQPRLKLRIENAQKTLVYYERPSFVSGAVTPALVKLYSVGDDMLLPFLEQCLGTRAIVEKTREVWRKGDAVFHLDTVKDVGQIFEVELQKEEIVEEDRLEFQNYQRALLPFLGQVIEGSNVDLVSAR